MKFNTYIAVALGFTSVLFSCQKLDQDPLDAISESNFWNTEKETLYAVTGLYSGRRGTDGKLVAGSSWEDGSQIFYMDCTSDNSNSDFPWEGFQALGNGNATPTDAGNASTRYSYELIRRANWILENIDKSPVSETLKNRLKAEVRVIRAYRYLDMATLFGAVPILTKTVSIEEAYAPANTQKEVLQFVETELKDAATILPAKYDASNVGRMTKGAALGLLARCYAFQNKHEEVISTTEQIITSGTYQLFGDYANLFEEANENNSEVMMDIQYVANIQGYTDLGIMMPNLSGGWSSIVPTQNLIDAYETKDGELIGESATYSAAQPYTNRDPRLSATVLYPGALYSGRYFDPLNPSSKDHPAAADNASSTGYNYKKYLQNPSSYSNVWNVGVNIIVMRYAEILLLNAEAKIESNKIDNSVYEHLNTVRLRAGMPKVNESVYNNQTKLRELVRREFRVEFAGEGRRRFDIIRWGIADVVMNGPVYGSLSKGSVNPQTGEVRFTNLTDRFFVENRIFTKGKNELWPIPQVVIDNSKGTLTQNPNY
ncbi:RagB/SusD family nutrient uptake outer membrane protein [Sphingobacterium spiritivorum]|uniref:RagB/SusD family nutrient uptake outer membrane protein n=1 Tax=Sphingobacterium spiritivorum TaxID=258 RepID=UPI003DA4E689